MSYTCTCIHIQTHKDTYIRKHTHSPHSCTLGPLHLTLVPKRGTELKLFQLESVFDGSNYSNILLDFDWNETSIKRQKQFFCLKLWVITGHSRSESSFLKRAQETSAARPYCAPPLPRSITQTFCTTQSPFWAFDFLHDTPPPGLRGFLSNPLTLQQGHQSLPLKSVSNTACTGKSKTWAPNRL